jgi:3'-phosphoadenosine 5'-phosphosulfate sulfotransferase (PAPS reductase)/FAD synthetase
MQSLPLNIKIRMSKRRIRDWFKYYGEEGVYIAWSGGKDSTVVRHLVREEYPDTVSVFSNTGLEYPEIQQFVKAAKKRGEPVEIFRPKMRFDEVIKKYGYPIISKEVSEKIRKARGNIRDGNYSLRLCQLGVMPDEYGGLKVDERYDYFGTAKGSLFDVKKYRPLLDVDFLISDECCWEMKKSVMIEYERATGRVPILGMMAAESKKRTQGWMKTGCNAFESDRPQSNPIAFWTEQDVLQYIRRYNLEIPSVYGEIVYAEEPGQMRMEEIAGGDFGCDELCTTGCHRTGCIFCAYGAHLSKGWDRFLRLRETHPRQYEYCVGGGEFGWISWNKTPNKWERFDFVTADGEPMTPEQVEEFVASNKENESFIFEKVWQPNKEGLGMGRVFDELNRIYGDGFIVYQ